MKPVRAIISSSFVFLALGAAPLFASAQVYKCVDASGKISYSNSGSSGKGCKPLSGEQSVSTISMRPSGSAASAPAAFPRVGNDAQRERDKARRQVLENELESERLALAEAQKALAEQEKMRFGDEKNYQKVLDRLQPYKDTVERGERNIEAITQEISELR